MKKIKVLPSILMLIACIAILGIGVFAIAPTKNTISGTITINAANNHLVLTVYKTTAVNQDGTEATQNKLVGPIDARAGVNLEIAEALAFDTAKANTKEDVAPVVLVIKIENKSNNELGAYFYNGLSTDTMPQVATEENVRTSYLFKANESDADEASLINTTLTGYRHLAPYDENTENDVTYMKITFKLNQFQEYTSNFNFPLNVEQYNEELDTSPIIKVNVSTSTLPPASQTISKNQANPTTFDGDLSFLVPNDGYYIGMNNINYTPASAQGATLLSDSTEPQVKFSFDLTANSETMKSLMELPEDTEITAEIMMGVGLLLFAGNYSSVEEVMTQEENELFGLELAEAVGSTITVYETEETANITEFCLVYMSFEDLALSLSTPAFKDGESLSIVTVETVENYNRVDLDFSTTVTYSLNPSTDENITQNISITDTKIANFPEDAKAINIYANIPKEQIYLVSKLEYLSMIGEGLTISEIIESIEEGYAGRYKQSTNAGAGTKITIPYIQITDGIADLTCIVLSQQEELQVTYSFEISNNMEDLIKFELVEDEINGDYYTVAGALDNDILEVVVPATYNNLPVKEIGERAFEGYTHLTTVDLSGAINLTSIGVNAFNNCDSLTTVDFSGATNLTSIGAGAFNSCDSLTTVDLSGAINLTSIGANAFCDCDSLTTVDLSGAINLTSIGANAFASCSKLTEITIPSSVTSIGASAFSGCTSLKTVYNNSELNIVVGETTHGRVAYYANYVYKNGIIVSQFVTEGNVVYKIFGDEKIAIKPANSSLTEIVISSDCTSIQDSAFKSYTKLTSADLSGAESLTSIGVEAFKGCTSLTTLDINTATSLDLGQHAFANCSKLNKFTLTAKSLYTECDDYAESWTFDSCVLLTTVDIKVTDSIYLSMCTFWACHALEEINFSAKSIYIGHDAFAFCSTLKKIVFEGITDLTGSYLGLDYGTLMQLQITIKSGVDLNSACELPTLSKTDYTFNGWYTNPEGTGEPVTEISADKYTEDTTYYAVWAQN